MPALAPAFALLTAASVFLAGGPDPRVTVRVDSSARTVTITSGPHHVAAADAATLAAMESASGPMHHHGVSEPFRRFTWPIDGWVRAVRLAITDREGREVSRQLVHHINVVNLERRMLFYDAPERLIAMGQETEDIALPASIGVPVTAGTEMGLVLMWHNMSETDYHDLTVTLTIEWSPTNLYPQPLDVLPVYMDVADPIGQPVDFDLPPGRHRFQADFTMPIDGRIIGVGGHIHDHGTGIVLEEISDGAARQVVALRTTLDEANRITAVERKYPGVRGRGIKLEQGRTYRLSGTYDNTSGRLLVDGAMIHMILLFAPSDPTQWPKVDPTARDWRVDVAELENAAKPAAKAGHSHH